MIARADVVAEARAWVGTKYEHQGRLRGVGVDCLGLVICVGRALGLAAADFEVTGYAQMPDGTMLEQCDRHMTRIHSGQIQPGDVLVLRYQRDPQHMAIVADYLHGGLSMIHADIHEKRVLEIRLADVMRARVVQAYALPGVV